MPALFHIMIGVLDAFHTINHKRRMTHNKIGCLNILSFLEGAPPRFWLKEKGFKYIYVRKAIMEFVFADVVEKSVYCVVVKD